ncbi:MAG: hypothetical protein HY078_17620 [Elusimicrobia bacterium]|nr:hypothetical protein [Elusimicrobiota bacterium]
MISNRYGGSGIKEDALKRLIVSGLAAALCAAAARAERAQDSLSFVVAPKHVNAALAAAAQARRPALKAGLGPLFAALGGR